MIWDTIISLVSGTSPSLLLRIGFILTTLILTLIIARIVRASILRFYTRLVWKEKTILHIGQTHYAITSRLLVACVYVVGVAAAIYQIPQAHTLFYSAMAGAGVLAIIIGFATKDVFANLVSGISIVVYNPFRVGDKITINNETGTVEDITLRHTVIRTWENKRIVIPNSIVSSQSITNSTMVDEKIRRPIEIGIDYTSDIDKAKKIMLQEAKKHPNTLSWIEKNSRGIKMENGPTVHVVHLADSSVMLRLYIWTTDIDTSHIAAWDIMENIKKRFDKEGIDIPFPHRTIVYKNKNHAKK